MNVHEFVDRGCKSDDEGDDANAKNITNSVMAIDDDPDWSPDGKRIVFTSHDVSDNHSNSISAEIYVLNVHGTAQPERLTYN